MRALFIALLAATGAVVAAGTGIAANKLTPVQPIYQPIPPGYDFPADQATLLKYRDNQDMAAIRAHVWKVFAGMTQPAAGGEAIWETWYPATTTFAPGGAQLQSLLRRPIRVFEKPRQFANVPMGPHLQAAGASNASFVLFNKDAHDFILSPLQRLYLKADLTAANGKFTTSTPIQDRAITPFPNTAMSVKTLWKRVSAHGGMVQVWDDDPSRPINAAYPYGSWPRSVVVDPNWNPSKPSQVTIGSQQYHVVSLDKFYHFQITAADLAGIKQLDAGAQVGDYMLLVLMHVTTKEIPDWVWATFWWHDRPDEAPYGADRPSNVPAVFSNYRMNATLSMETPKESDGSAKIVFNPYIEAGFTGGIASNCMNCHMEARWPKPRPLEFTVERGLIPPTDPRFANSIRTDFLWSIIDRAR